MSAHDYWDSIAEAEEQRERDAGLFPKAKPSKVTRTVEDRRRDSGSLFIHRHRVPKRRRK